MKNEKLTIFLSHSHQDEETVRKIRDVLEILNCEPLIFFLKCLDDNNTELEDFIKREIEARNIFLYCKSSNAEHSVWVQKELEYIKSFDEKRLYEIDIENGFEKGAFADGDSDERAECNLRLHGVCAAGIARGNCGADMF